MSAKNLDPQISDLKNVIEQAKQDKNNLVSNVKELTKQNKELQVQIAQLNKVIKQKDAVINSQQSSLAKKEEEVQKYCTAAIDARKKMEALNKDIINFKIKTNDALTKLNNAKEKYQNLIETYNNLVNDNKAKNSEINSLRQENADLDYSLKESKKANENLASQLMQYKERLDQYDEYIRRYKEYLESNKK